MNFFSVSDISYDDDQDEDYVFPTDTDSDEDTSPIIDISKYQKSHIQRESPDHVSVDRVTESADCLDSNCVIEDDIQNNATPCSEKVTELDLKKLGENQIIRDVNFNKIYMRKHLKLSGQSSGQMRKKKTTERIYNNYHCCLFCSRFVQHINTHLKTHKNLSNVQKLFRTENPDFSEIRKLGDDRNNQKVIENKEGEILIARRPSNNLLDIQQYGPCPNCREWLQLSGLKKHLLKCLKGRSKEEVEEGLGNCVLKSQVMAGLISEKTSKQMREEVLPAMKRDSVRHVAMTDELILMLGESWLRRNVDNVEKRKYYSSQHMRLAAKLLIQLREMKVNKKQNETEENSDISLWEFLTPDYFDMIVDASLQVSMPEIDDISELKSPSNAIKLKYDLKRLVNMKYAFLLKTNQEGREVSDCKSFLKLMTLEWSERVTKVARTILQQRKFMESKDLPSPEDIEKLTRYLVLELGSIQLIPENYMKIAVLCQTRLMMYNKRRSGELEVIT